MAVETQLQPTQTFEMSQQLATSTQVVSHQLLHYLARYTNAYHFIDLANGEPTELPAFEKMVAVTGLAIVTDPHDRGVNETTLMIPHGDRTPPGRSKQVREQFMGSLRTALFESNQEPGIDAVIDYVWQREMKPSHTYDSQNRRIPCSHLTGGLLVVESADAYSYTGGVFYEKTFLHRIKSGIENIRHERSDLFWGRVQKTPERLARTAAIPTEQSQQASTAMAHTVAQRAILATLTRLDVPEGAFTS